MAKQAEAERERRAKIIHAEGEFQAAQQLAEAADVIARQPMTLQLRYLQTLTEIATEKNSTIIFPLPIDLLKAFLPGTDRAGAGKGERTRGRSWSRASRASRATTRSRSPTGRCWWRSSPCSPACWRRSSRASGSGGAGRRAARRRPSPGRGAPPSPSSSSSLSSPARSPVAPHARAAGGDPRPQRARPPAGAAAPRAAREDCSHAGGRSRQAMRETREAETAASGRRPSPDAARPARPAPDGTRRRGRRPDCRAKPAAPARGPRGEAAGPARLFVQVYSSTNGARAREIVASSRRAASRCSSETAEVGRADQLPGAGGSVRRPAPPPTRPPGACVASYRLDTWVTDTP